MGDNIKWDKRSYEAAVILKEALNGDKRAQEKFVSEALGTSDFPSVLTPALNKQVYEQYQAAPVVWRSFARTQLADDFTLQELASYKFNTEGIPGVNAGQAYVDGTLPRIPELAEYPLIGIEGTGLSWSVFKSGARFGLSWERVVNNRQFGEIEKAVTALSDMAVKTEESAATSYFVTGGGINTTTLTSGSGSTNDCLLDGNPVLSEASLEAAFLKAATHKIDGETIIMPTTFNLVIPSSLLFTAEKVLSVTGYQDPTTGLIGPNPLAGKFTIVVNDWITRMGGTNGATTWFIAPKPAEYATGGSAVGFLRGADTPKFFVKSTIATGTEPGDFLFDDDSYQTKIRHTATPIWVGQNAGCVISNGSGS